MWTFVTTLWWLLAAHAVTDFALQDDRMIELKNPTLTTLAERPTYGPWWWWMLAHGLINGAGVGWVTGSAALGALETVAHINLDLMKCQRHIGRDIDQLGHVLYKVLWAVCVAWNR